MLKILSRFIIHSNNFSCVTFTILCYNFSKLLKLYLTSCASNATLILLELKYNRDFSFNLISISRMKFCISCSLKSFRFVSVAYENNLSYLENVWKLLGFIAMLYLLPLYFYIKRHCKHQNKLHPLSNFTLNFPTSWEMWRDVGRETKNVQL